MARLEWLATFGAFSRDRAIPNRNSAVLVEWSGARTQLCYRLTAINDFDVSPEVAGVDGCQNRGPERPLDDIQRPPTREGPV